MREMTILANDIVAGAGAQRTAKALYPVHRDMESRIGTTLIGATCKPTGFDPHNL
jgi:hypothetical protein